MTGFEPQISGVTSDRSTNRATTNCQLMHTICYSDFRVSFKGFSIYSSIYVISR